MSCCCPVSRRQKAKVKQWCNNVNERIELWKTWNGSLKNQSSTDWKGFLRIWNANANLSWAPLQFLHITLQTHLAEVLNTFTTNNFLRLKQVTWLPLQFTNFFCVHVCFMYNSAKLYLRHPRRPLQWPAHFDSHNSWTDRGREPVKTRGELAQDQDWISCRILAIFVKQDWIWISCFEENLIRTGSGYLFNCNNEIFLRVMFSLLWFYIHKKSKLFCQYVLHSSKSMIWFVFLYRNFFPAKEVVSCSYNAGMLLCWLCWVAYAWVMCRQMFISWGTNLSSTGID